MYNSQGKEVKLSELQDKIITSIEGCDIDNDEIIFTLIDGSKYRMYHSQDCCEHVRINDINGDIKDLIGTPLNLVEESTNDEFPIATDKDGDKEDSFTWTFYRFGTIKGYVDIKWLGVSNGYYS